jgi:PKD repeat protein
MKVSIKFLAFIPSLLVGISSAMACVSSPVAASCTPNTLSYCCGFGITNVTFNTFTNSTNDGVDGYTDSSCVQTTVLEGQSYTLSIQTSASSTQNYAAWIDFNNDGVLDDVTERVFTATSQFSTSGNINIPVGAVLNTPLRMRVSADYDLSAPPTPCADLDYGQAEDYGVIITANPNPPAPSFIGTPTVTCSGTVCFTDQSLNVPTGWLWNFGDGNTSFQQNPCHTYATDGTYTVTLTATNSNGSNTDSIVNYITVNTAGQVLPASCSPSTLAYCCGYGIYQVSFNTINKTSADGSVGYQDFSCSNSTQVNEGSNHIMSITTGANNPQDTRVWIDFNNDGVFNNTNELVLDDPNSYNPTQFVSIPFGAVLNTPLRMRISSDVIGVAQSACDPNEFGQTEDYGVIIKDPNSVEDNSLSSGFRVYPNPATAVLYIEKLNFSTIQNISIYTILGQKIVERKEDFSKTAINISDFEKGVYLIRIKSEEGLFIHKVNIY